MNRKTRRTHGKQAKEQKKSPAAALVTPEAIGTIRTLIDNGFFPEATELFKILLELDPSNIPLILYGAQAAYLNESMDMAEDLFQKILHLQPDNADALSGMGFVRAYQNRFEEALDYILPIAPEKASAKILAQIGRVYNHIGKLDTALDYLKRSIKKDPSYLAAHFEMQNMKKFTADDPQFLQLKKLYTQKDNLSDADQYMLGYVLGKAYLDIKEADTGFQHYAEANALKKKSAGDSEMDKHERYADSIIKLFNEDFIKKFKTAGTVKSNRPIFIVGMPRSGSTLVDQILSSHPSVNGFGEKDFLIHCIPALRNEEIRGYALSRVTQEPKNPTITKRLLEAITPEALDIMANNYLSKTDVYAKNAARVIDKMLFNFPWVGLIRLMLPQAKIIHCVRDPVDIGLSIWKLWFSDSIPWAYDLQEIGRYYNSYKKVMDHWHKMFPGEIHQVKYEDMVANQEQESRRLLEFCNLSWDDKVLSFYDNERAVQTASMLQVRQPIYTDSVKKWKKFEKHLQPLIQELVKSGPYS